MLPPKRRKVGQQSIRSDLATAAQGAPRARPRQLVSHGAMAAVTKAKPLARCCCAAAVRSRRQVGPATLAGKQQVIQPARAHLASNVCRATPAARSNMIATLMAGVMPAFGHANGLAVVNAQLNLDQVPLVVSWNRCNDGLPAQCWLCKTIALLFAPEP